MDSVFTLDNLTVRFATKEGAVAAVSDLSFALGRGECLGIVGESGSGKSQTFLASMGLLAPNGHATGRALFQGQDLLKLDREALNKIRGNRMAMIFQDSGTSLTPHMKVGNQLMEVLTTHKGLSAEAAKKRILEVMEAIRIPEIDKRLNQYPHEFSGGMRQRVMIAMALLCEPDLLIADEPTTALDVTVQAQILQLFKALKQHTRSAIVLITHDLGVVAGLCDRVIVMYGGRVVEEGPVADIFANPKHPYTQGLLKCMPRLDQDLDAELEAIPGQPPNLQKLPPGCAFAERCTHALPRCAAERPGLRDLGPGRRAACHLLEAA
ncbi:MAG: ABC transporter ATP-binding protein [Rhodospirillaceae bacterium]|nr:ABC transporter ATP-binding protein [Rhodospirillaceae bacterium]